MNNKRRFTVTTGPNNSIRLYESDSGRLFRTINVGQQITSQPIATEGEVFVTVETASGPQVNYYGLPGGNLIRTVRT